MATSECNFIKCGGGGLNEDEEEENSEPFLNDNIFHKYFLKCIFFYKKNKTVFLLGVFSICLYLESIQIKEKTIEFFWQRKTFFNIHD